jgi:hypothetical protein
MEGTVFTATLCLLQDLIEASDDAIGSLEADIRDLDHAHPAIAAVRTVQRQYGVLILAQAQAIDELRKLTPATFCRDESGGAARPLP